MCVALAEAGVIGATRIIEGKNGFLKAYTPNQNIDLHRLVDGLGSKWHWLSNALKPYPACRMTHALIELSGIIRKAFEAQNGRPLRTDDVQKIDVWIPVSNHILVGDPVPNKINPRNVVDAQFSAYFQVAHALLYGSKSGLQAYERLQDPSVQALARKITVIGDENAVRGFPGRVRVVWQDGSEEEKYQKYALGEEQHPLAKSAVEEKYFSLASPIFGEEKAQAILQTVNALETKSVEDLILLLQ